MAFPQRTKTKMEGLNSSGPSNSMANQSSVPPPTDVSAEPMPDEQEPAAGQSILVPSEAIDMHGSSPEDGDPVEFSVTGTKTGTEGKMYRVSLMTANGKDIPQDAAMPDDEAAEGESTGDMESKLRGMFPSNA